MILSVGRGLGRKIVHSNQPIDPPGAYSHHESLGSVAEWFVYSRHNLDNVGISSHNFVTTVSTPSCGCPLAVWMYK